MSVKRIVSAALLAVMLICAAPLSAVSADALPFKDVKETAWYYGYVKYVYDNGLMAGDGKTTFSPGKSLTRAMFVTIIGRLAGAGGGGRSPFTDTADDSWYSPYVSWAADNGIVSGYPDGTFRPDVPISREQMATLVSRYIDAFGLRTVNSGGIFRFNDAEKVSGWAKDPVDSLKKIGIFAGDNKMNFNPGSYTTRAEAAAVIMRLREAITGAWQGYQPDSAEGAALIYGAAYLFENGPICAGGMAKELDETGEYPLLRAYMDTGAAFRTYLEANTVGVSINAAEIDVKATPLVKICYSFDGMEDAVPAARYSVNMTKVESGGFAQELTVTEGEDEDGMATAYVDLREVEAKHPNAAYSTELANLLFVPCEDDISVEGRFVIKYIGFFGTEDDARAFSASADPEISDYLKNYHLGSNLDWREYTEADREYYDNLLRSRIAEIKNSESELTPEAVKARGGKCYYVSSIHGDDKNDGLSPETPWKTPAALYKYYPGSDVYISKAKPGDGVFFERGSVFYPHRYMENSVRGLECAAGVDYGAYGEGPKPLFTCALDFSESGNVGNWVESGYPNIWKIDKVDTRVKKFEDGSEDEKYWQGERSAINNMYFDGGKYVGLKISASGPKQTFGDGITSNDKGLFFNGFEWYDASPREMTDPGTALLHNLEFFHDYETGSLYLYWDRGNPADYFHDIKAGRRGSAVIGADNSLIDNLAFVYSGMCCLEAGNRNVTVKNCEIGCVHGALSSDESGLFVYGPSDGIYVLNCYFHDVGDGAATSQGGGSPGAPNQIKNVNYIGNVMVACGHSAEIWNGLSDIDENGVSASKITDCLLKDNIMAYGGYGPRQKQDTSRFAVGETVCGSVYGEFERCRIEGNIFLYGMGSIYCAYMATYEQPRGWESLGNVYVADGDFYNIGYSFETLNHIDHGMWKRARVFFPYTKEGLAWYTAQGVDPKGIYFRYESDDPHQTVGTGYPDDTVGAGYFDMTGYRAEHGGE